MTMLFGQALALSRFASLGNFFTSLYGESDGDFFTLAASHIFQDTAGTTPATNGDPLGRVTGALGNYNALQPVSASRPTFRIAANGDRVAEHDEIDDVLPVTFPDLGSECTVFWVTQSEIWLVEDQAVSGATNPPTTDWIFWGVIDRAFTTSEKIELIKQAERSATGVRYGGTLSRLQEIMLNAVARPAIFDLSEDNDGGAASEIGGLPRVGVAVPESNAVKIYDATDPDLPLVWTQTSGVSATSDYSAFHGTPGDVTYSEGKVIFCLAGVSAARSGVVVLDFALGEAARYANNTSWGGYGLALTEGVLSDDLPSRFTVALVNSVINDVTAYVQPDAPTNGTTGLKVPTIAVGTAGGLSVILDDGTVTDSAITTNVKGVAVNSSGIFYISTANNRLDFATWTDVEAGDGFGDQIASTAVGTQEIDLIGLGDSLVATDDLVAIGSTISSGTPEQGLFLVRPDYSDFSKSLTALITTDFNTGWMLNPLGCYLCDSDDTDVVGATPLDDDFTSYADQAAVESAGYTIDSGWTFNAANDRFELDAATAQAAGTNQFISFTASGLTVGETYVFEMQVSGTSNLDGSEFQAILTGYGYLFLDGSTNILGNGTARLTITAISTSVDVSIRAIGANLEGTETAYIDGFYIKLAEPDRSVNGNGAIIEGTITKTKLGEADSLVKYGGFTNGGNGIQVPSDPVFAPGTGDFHYSIWAVNTNTGSNMFLWAIGNAAKTNYSFGVRRDTSSGTTMLRVYLGGSVRLVSTGGMPTGLVKVDVVRTGGTLYLYINGALNNSAADTTNVTEQSGVQIGRNYAGGEAWNGELFWFKPESTAKSAAQIAQAYADELPLAQGGAAVLTGTDSAVDAVAIDPDTGLIHAGSSDGRSIFDGLERVQKTTNSVSTNITAKGGLVLEK